MLGGRAVTGDPWRLFPDAVREFLPLPPGEGPPKVRYAEYLRVLQSRPPLWVRAQVAEPEKIWDELRALGLKPWIHRRMTQAARLEPGVDVYHLPAFVRGDLEIQDLASQAVGKACDPEPGERWWDMCAGAGGKSLELAALMGGKGVIIATDRHQARLKETVRRARKSPFRNISTREWDGKHVAGKSGSYDGVLVDAPCSAIGTWRRNPDARWVFDPASVPRLAEVQKQLVGIAARGVKVGGTLVYSVCTPAPAETVDVIKAFLDSHPGFRLDPFPHPFTGDPTRGQLLIWPGESDSDQMFIARMLRTA
jgi:16S rRNA (cytosine967-C5)-methyltransferase